MTPRIEIAANIVRLLMAAGVMIVQAALLYSLSIVRARSSIHREDCPFSRPWWRVDVQVPDPIDCPHCIWSRIYSYNRNAVLIAWVVLALALLSAVFLAVA